MSDDVLLKHQSLINSLKAELGKTILMLFLIVKRLG